MSIVLSDLDAFEREAILEYLASETVDFDSLNAMLVPHPHSAGGGSGDEAVAIDVDFPEEFFDVLAEMADEHKGAEDAERDSESNRPLRCHSWVRKTIDKFYEYRWSQFHLEFTAPDHHVSPNLAINDVSTHLYQFITKEMGIGDLVRRYALDILEGVRAYRGRDLYIQLFGVLLHSGHYDDKDTRALLSWLASLSSTTIFIRVDGFNQPHVRLRDVPFLLRQCLMPDQGTVLLRSVGGVPNAGAIPTIKSRGAWERARSALATWCDASGRVPAVASDPKFYIPPFSPSHPYVGRSKGRAIDEGRFAKHDANILIPLAQLLTLMLLNFKEERREPLAL